MQTAISRIRLYTLSALSLALGLASVPAQALPSFARQTGMPCQSCHTIYPELTAFGRSFKLNGYTMTNIKQISVPKKLSINDTFPFSVMVQAGITHQKKVAPSNQNNSIAFPQELSLYLAGAITPHMGAFLQTTYNTVDDHFTFDMADFRYANRTTVAGNDLIYGVSMDNMPGMEDVWNNTPAWTYPYAAPSDDMSYPAPDADVLVNGLMGAGIGAYAMLDSHWYASMNFYRTAFGDIPTIKSGMMPTINGVAPYVRLAWENTFSNQAYLQIGTYALQANFIGGQDGSGIASKQDQYTDVAVDATYQLPVNNGDLISLHGVFINENQTLDSTVATDPSNTLKQTRIDGNYEFGHGAQLSLGYFGTSGNVYNGSAYQDDGSAGYIAEADYLPWENTKFSLQYKGYSKFDGDSSNASNNDTLYANAWLMW